MDTDDTSSADRVTVPKGVGTTALMVAATRAAESARPDRLFTDPYAGDFVRAGGLGGTAPDPSGAWDSFVTYAAIRTRFFDDYLAAATESIHQVVILAAGLDTRAFRLGLPPDTMVYEVDTAGMLDFKQRVLDAAHAQHAGRRIPVATDLREDWVTPLRTAGFDPSAPTAWLIEGLQAYLSPTDNDRLLDTVTAQSAPGSQVSIEFLSSYSVQLMVDAQGDSDSPLKSLWSGGGVDGESGPWLRSRGWESVAYDVYERAEHYGRPLPPLGDSPMDKFSNASRRGLVIGHR